MIEKNSPKLEKYSPSFRPPSSSKIEIKIENFFAIPEFIGIFTLLKCLFNVYFFQSKNFSLKSLFDLHDPLGLLVPTYVSICNKHNWNGISIDV